MKRRGGGSTDVKGRARLLLKKRRDGARRGRPKSSACGPRALPGTAGVPPALRNKPAVQKKEKSAGGTPAVPGRPVPAHHHARRGMTDRGVTPAAANMALSAS